MAAEQITFGNNYLFRRGRTKDEEMARLEDIMKVGPVLKAPEGFAACAQAARLEGIVDRAAENPTGAQHRAGTHICETRMHGEEKQANRHRQDYQENASDHQCEGQDE